MSSNNASSSLPSRDTCDSLNRPEPPENMDSTQQNDVSAPNELFLSVQTSLQPQHETKTEKEFDARDSKHSIKEKIGDTFDSDPALSQPDQQRADGIKNLTLVSDLSEQLETASIADPIHRVMSTDGQVSAQSSFATNLQIKIPLTPGMVALAPLHNPDAVSGGFRDALMHQIRVSVVNINDRRPIVLTTVTAPSSLHAAGCAYSPSCRSRGALETGRGERDQVQGSRV